MLRVSWCIFCSISLLFDYMCMRLPFILWSIAGVPSSQALPGFLITAPPSVCIPAVLGALAVWFESCCFYHFVTNSLVALLEFTCAWIPFFRFVKISFFLTFFFCARSLTKPYFRPPQPGSCAWLSPFLLCADCTCVLVCVCLYVHVKICR